MVCGIYHGTEEMCEQRKTSIQSGVNPQWKEFLEFDIPVSELPRMAKLCFSIVGRKRGQAKKVKFVDIIFSLLETIIGFFMT